MFHTGPEALELARRWRLPLRHMKELGSQPFLAVVTSEESPKRVTALDKAKILLQAIEQPGLDCAGAVVWRHDAGVEGAVRYLLNNNVRVFFPDSGAEEVCRLAGTRIDPQERNKQLRRSQIIAEIEGLLRHLSSKGAA
jgi:hypothetical protein